MERQDIERELEALHPRSFGWALTCCGWDRDRAEEVLQTACLKALDGRARFAQRSSLRTWFFGVIKKTAAEQRRSGMARALGILRFSSERPTPSPTPDPERLSGDAEDREQLRRMLARLAPRQRDLLHLVFYQELTIEQAASVLAISVGSARTHYERGKVRLRALLARTEKVDAREEPVRPANSRTVCGS